MIINLIDTFVQTDHAVLMKFSSDGRWHTMNSIRLSQSKKTETKCILLVFKAVLLTRWQVDPNFYLITNLYKWELQALYKMDAKLWFIIYSPNQYKNDGLPFHRVLDLNLSLQVDFATRQSYQLTMHWAIVEINIWRCLQRFNCWCDWSHWDCIQPIDS